MKWTSNNNACKTIWSSLMALDQISENESFRTTGNIKVGTLAFYPVDGSDDIVITRAKSLAIQLDKIFRLIRGAVYEESINQVDAVKALVEVLKNSEKSVSDLADISDDMYLFYKEEDRK